MSFFGIGLGIFAFFGFLTLLVDWVIRSARVEKEQKERLNLAALNLEIQLLQESKNLSQQGGEFPEEVELILQKQLLEKKLVELQMQGVTQGSLYHDVHHQINQVESHLKIVDRGKVGRLIIKEQGKIRQCLHKIAEEQAIALMDFKKDLERRFSPGEVQEIMQKAEEALRETMVMTEGALTKNQQMLSSQ